MHYCCYMSIQCIRAPNIPTMFKHLQLAFGCFLFPGPSQFYLHFCHPWLCSHYNFHSVSFLLSTHAKTCTTMTVNVININKLFSHLGSLFGRSRTWCICSIGLPLQGSFTTGSSSLLPCSFQLKYHTSIIFFDHSHILVYMFTEKYKLW